MGAEQSNVLESRGFVAADRHHRRCAARLESLFHQCAAPSLGKISLEEAKDAIQPLQMALRPEHWADLDTTTQGKQHLDFQEFQALVRKVFLRSCGCHVVEIEGLFIECVRALGGPHADRAEFHQSVRAESLDAIRAMERMDGMLKRIGLSRDIFHDMGPLCYAEFEIVLAYEIDLRKRMKWLTDHVLRDLASRLPPSLGPSVSESIVNAGPADLDLDFSSLGAQIVDIARQDTERARGIRNVPGGTSSKLAEDASELQYGTLENFVEGLEGIVGEPMADIAEGMRQEHMEAADSNSAFNPGNYLITTTPRAEYLAVTDDDYRVELNNSPESVSIRRRIPSKAQREAAGRAAELIDAEELAVVLYTGPMFYKYNSLMRGFPVTVVEGCSGNRYANTIHLIVSGLRKLAWKSPVPPNGVLYRGVKGLRLPAKFVEQNDLNVSGGVERAFLSATDDRAVAIFYSQGSEEGGMRMIFEFSVGSVDRPARISQLSQFPEEGEYCFFPLAYLELSGATRWERATDGGTVLVVPVRVNSNMTGLTLQQRLEQRKKLLLSTHRWTRSKLERDVERLLASEAAAAVAPERKELFRQNLLRGFDEVRDGIKKSEAGVFNDDRQFKAAAQRVLDMDTFARSTMALAAKDPARFRTDATTTRLRERHMELDQRLRDDVTRALASGDRAAATAPATELCRMRGVVVEELGELNECGDPPLVREAALGNLLNVGLLLAAGVDPCSANAKRQTALALAAANGHLECLTALVEAVHASDDRGSVHAPDDHGSTPLHRAAFNGRVDCVKALLLHKADAEARDAHFEETPLMKASYGGDVGTVAVLLAHGQVDLADKKGRTALFHAAKKGHSACVQLLVESGASLRVRDLKGQSPLAIAQEEGHQECAALLQRLMQHTP